MLAIMKIKRAKSIGIRITLNHLPVLGIVLKGRSTLAYMETLNTFTCFSMEKLIENLNEYKILNADAQALPTWKCLKVCTLANLRNHSVLERHSSLFSLFERSKNYITHYSANPLAGCKHLICTKRLQELFINSEKGRMLLPTSMQI